MLELAPEVRAWHSIYMTNVKQLIFYQMLGIVIILYVMIETAVEMGREATVMKSSD